MVSDVQTHSVRTQTLRPLCSWKRWVMLLKRMYVIYTLQLNIPKYNNEIKYPRSKENAVTACKKIK